MLPASQPWGPYTMIALMTPTVSGLRAMGLASCQFRLGGAYMYMTRCHRRRLRTVHSRGYVEPWTLYSYVLPVCDNGIELERHDGASILVQSSDMCFEYFVVDHPYCNYGAYIHADQDWPVEHYTYIQTRATERYTYIHPPAELAAYRSWEPVEYFKPGSQKYALGRVTYLR